MKHFNRALYLLIPAVALVPVGLRVMTWRSAKGQEVDPRMAGAGKVLFKHQWTKDDPLCNGGDGLGPVFNANSCVACHNQGGDGGAGALAHNVTTFTVRSPARGVVTRSGVVASEGVVHKFAIGREHLESLQLVSPELPDTSQPTLSLLVSLPNNNPNPHCLQGRFPRGIHVSQRNTPALFGARLIDELPDRVIIAAERKQKLKHGLAPAESELVPVGRALRLADGRVGKFGWKAQTASLSDFVRAACANELGLGNPTQNQPRSMRNPNYWPTKLDLTDEQCNQLTAFVASLPRPEQRLPEDTVHRQRANLGEKMFHTVGCAECHLPNLGSVEGLYSDLLLHKMGEPLEGGGSYNEPPIPDPSKPDGDAPSPGEWRTPPLWGVGDSAPYLHDGRAATLEEAIKLHGGQAARSVQKFSGLSAHEQAALVGFLKSLRAPAAAAH
jgi:CxxC motif-containing protein (DUF1111 family)